MAPVQQQMQERQDPCQMFNMNFINCLKSANNDIAICQPYMDQLTACQKDNSSAYTGL